MRAFSVTLLVILLILTQAAAADTRSPHPETAESPNFFVRSFQNGPLAADVLEDCKRLRADLQHRWHGDDMDAAWNTRCEVVLHPTYESYLQTVGRGGQQTRGSSLIRISDGRVLARRIDLLTDGQGNCPALPHELTHIVLVERFARGRLPRWLDEGIATMADASEKKRLHYRDCREALRLGTGLRIVDLLVLDRFESPDQVAAFYGQSLTLVEFLAGRDSPRRILEFAEAAMKHGYDRALRDHYAIDGVAALERAWRQHLATPTASKSNDMKQPLLTAQPRR